jgi:hypothetical protein
MTTHQSMQRIQEAPGLKISTESKRIQKNKLALPNNGLKEMTFKNVLARYS